MEAAMSQAREREPGVRATRARVTSCDYERWLLRRYRELGDRAALEQLTRRMMPLVRRIAWSYGGSDREDAEQAGGVGLAKALVGYDPSKRIPIRAYAIPKIVGEIRRHARDHDAPIRLPRSLHERVPAVRQTASEMTARLGRSPTCAELAAARGETVSQVAEALTAGHQRYPASLDAPLDDATARLLGSAVGCRDERLALAEARIALAQVRTGVNECAWSALVLCFVDGMNETAIGRELKVPSYRVAALVEAALVELTRRGLLTCDEELELPALTRSGQRVIGAALQRSLRPEAVAPEHQADLRRVRTSRTHPVGAAGTR